MAEAGWYDDPEQPGVLRWWDGEQWTDHRRPVEEAPTPTSPGGDVLVHVGIGKGERTELTATAADVTIRGETFAWAALDGVEYTAVRSHQNGAYMGTYFTLHVREGERKQSFMMATNHKDERLEEFRDAYGRLVNIVDTLVCSRIAAALAARLEAGETITLGPAGARVELTKEGFRLKKPLSKVVPWASVTGVEVEGGTIYFLVRKKEGHDPKRHSMVGLGGENMVVLPHLLPRLRAG
jgi:hypothetical protein